MILPVVHYPSPILKTSAELVDIRDPKVLTLVRDMMETMNQQPRCVGLAAPQVGFSWRVIVVDASRVDKPGSRHGPLALLNPSIVLGTTRKLLREGCLSVPDYTGNLLRAESVTVQGWDPSGQWREIHAEGFESIVFQHEVDHLEGKLFLDRVASLETDVFRRKKYG